MPRAHLKRIGLPFAIALATFVLGGPGQSGAATGKSLPPYARTTGAEAFGRDAILFGFVNARRTSTTVQWEVGMTKSYGRTIPPTAEIERFYFYDEPVAVEELVDHLRRETTYHFRLVATSVGGKTYGKDKTFRTR